MKYSAPLPLRPQLKAVTIVDAKCGISLTPKDSVTLKRENQLKFDLVALVTVSRKYICVT